MKLLEELNARYDDSEVLPDFTTEEGVALVNLAYLVMLSDREMTDGELQRFKERIFGLTLADGDMRQDVLSGGEIMPPLKVREMVGDDDAVARFIEEQADRITGGDHRSSALRVLATLSYTDGMDEGEEGVCHEIGRAFGLDEDAIEDLLIDGAIDVWELGGDAVE